MNQVCFTHKLYLTARLAILECKSVRCLKMINSKNILYGIGFMRCTVPSYHANHLIWIMMCWCEVRTARLLFNTWSKCYVILSGSNGIRFQRRLEKSNGHDRSKLSQSWLLWLKRTENDREMTENIICVQSKVDQPQNSSSYQSNMYSKCLINSSKFICSS